MNPNAIIRRSATLRCIKRSPILSASLSVPDRTQNRSTGYILSLAHEVRNPLCTINLALEMLSSTNLDEEQRQYLGIITRGTARINELINTLLVSDQGDETVIGVYSLHQLLEEILLLARDRITLKNITVFREYTAIEHKVLLDKEKMKMALTNIIINAIDAMASENGQLKLVTRSIGELSSIEIQDNGIGISQEHLKKIFQPYFTNKPGGMGLGLAATWDIIRANHARIDVRSEEGIGTCFTLSFNRG